MTATVPPETTMHVHDTISHYLKNIAWPFIIATVFHVSILSHPNKDVLTYLTYAGFILYIVAYCTRQRASWLTAAWISGIGSGLLACIISVYILITAFSFVQIFSLFTHTIFFGTFAALAGGLLAICVQMISMSIYSMKGGDAHGKRQQ